MIKQILYMLKNKRGDITWQHIVAFIIALIILVIMVFISIKSKNDMGSVGEKIKEIIS